jgi:hypothetical protein
LERAGFALVVPFFTGFGATRFPDDRFFAGS